MRISDWSSDVCSSDLVAAPKHPKAALQEWALARKRKPPEYRLVRREGPDHSPRFHVAVSVGKLAEAEGEGASKQAAEKAAAAALLAQLAERSEEHTSELQSLMRISYSVFCLKKKKSRI